MSDEQSIALSLGKWLATSDFLDVLWDPRLRINPFCRRIRSWRTLAGTCSPADAVLRDTRLASPPPTMPPEEGPRTHRQEDRGLELSQLLLLTTGGKDHENPKDLHSRGDQGVQGSIITPSSAFKGSASWTSAWGEITRMRVWNHPPSTNHHGCEKPPATAQAFKNPQGRAQRKEIFFKPNYLCIGYPLGYLGLNIKIRGVQLFEKCKLVVVLISFFGNTVPSFFSFFFFLFWGVSISSVPKFTGKCYVVREGNATRESLTIFKALPFVFSPCYSGTLCINWTPLNLCFLSWRVRLKLPISNFNYLLRN